MNSSRGNSVEVTFCNDPMDLENSVTPDQAAPSGAC